MQKSEEKKKQKNKGAQFSKELSNKIHPNKLRPLCPLLNQGPSVGAMRQKKLARQIAECVTNVVYEIKLSHEKSNIGKTGRCVNDRLRQHAHKWMMLSSAIGREHIEKMRTMHAWNS